MQLVVDPEKPPANELGVSPYPKSPPLSGRNPIGDGEEADHAEERPVHSVFSRRMKILIVSMTTLSTLFSPISSFIYLPVLNTLALDYHRSIADMNLTVTTYKIFQGLAPMFFGDLADQIGRRPVYILTFCIYCCANLGLALQNNYPALLILRALQSTGSSGTVALGNGVIGDIVTSAERGGYIGIVQAGVQFGPALAPIIGGLLAQFLGWRSIFWFLLISSGIYLVLYFVLVPETGRNIVGNGSVAPRGWNLGQRTIHFPNPIRALRIIVEKDIAPIMFFTSMLFFGLYCMMVPLPNLFSKAYNFNDLQVGLCFLPLSFGAISGSIICGRILDWNFKRVANQVGVLIDLQRGNELRGFPIEKARLEVVGVPMLVGSAAIIAWGWTLQTHTNLAIPLIVLFIAGLSLSGVMGMLNTLLVDLYPESPATVTASLNVCRCSMSAAGTAIIQFMIDAMGLGWSFTLLGLVLLALSPLLWVVIKSGPKWREQRYVRQDKQKAAKEEKKAGRLRKNLSTKEVD